MKFSTLSSLTLASAVLSSCVYYTNPVPEMPYTPYKPNPAVQRANEQALAAAAQAEGTWYTTSPDSTANAYLGATIPAPVAATPQPAPAVTTPAPAKPTTAITQAPLKLNPVTTKPAAEAKPSVPELKPATAATATATKPATQTPKEITNNGPIPVATPVPGDPTRVYNPLDSSKTIRITDKNGKVYPSGKELKVRGTNFHFYVP